MSDLRKKRYFPAITNEVSALMHVLCLVVTLFLVAYNTLVNYKPLVIVIVARTRPVSSNGLWMIHFAMHPVVIV